MNTVTHLAAPAFRLSDGDHERVIQRCMICGEKLCDSLNAAMPLRPDGTADSFPTWPPGRMVQATVGGNPTRWLLLDEDDGRLPKDSCLELVE